MDSSASSAAAQQYQELYNKEYVQTLISNGETFYNLIKTAAQPPYDVTALSRIIGNSNEWTAVKYRTQYQLRITTKHPASFIDTHSCLVYRKKKEIIKCTEKGKEGFIERHNRAIEAKKAMYFFNQPLNTDMAQLACERDATRTVPAGLKSSEYEPLPTILDAQFKDKGWEMNLRVHECKKSTKDSTTHIFYPPKDVDAASGRTGRTRNADISYNQLAKIKGEIEGDWTIDQPPSFDKYGDRFGKIDNIPNNEVTNNDYLVGLPPAQSDQIKANKEIRTLAKSYKESIIEARKNGSEAEKKNELLKKIRLPASGGFVRVLRPVVSTDGVVTKWNDIGDNNVLQYLLDYLINWDGIEQQPSDFITGGLAFSMGFSIIDACKDASDSIRRQNTRTTTLLNNMQQEPEFSNMSTTEAFTELGGLVHSSTRAHSAGNKQNLIQAHGLLDLGQKQQEINASSSKKKAPPKKKKKKGSNNLDDETFSSGSEEDSPPPPPPAASKKKKKAQPTEVPSGKKAKKKAQSNNEDLEELPIKKKARTTTTTAKKKTKSKKYDDDSDDMDFEAEEEPPPKKRATKKKAPAKKKASRRDDSDDDSDARQSV